MRILRVTSDLYPYVVGGLGLHTREMSRSQVKQGHMVTVLTTSLPDGVPSEQDGFNILYFNNFIKLFGNAFSPDLVFKILNNKKYDVIHAHSHLFFSTNICALVRKFRSTPLIITNHGIMSASAPDLFNLLYLKTLGKWTLNAADRVICYTDEEKEYLINILHINASKISVIPNGVDTVKFCPSNEIKHTDDISLLWVGRFVNGKGVDSLIRAMDILVKDVPNVHLTLVGDGPERGAIQMLIKKFALDNYVEIIDFVPNDELPNIYQTSDIFVLPSLHEGVPRTVIEAMSCGLPVVMSDMPHLRELINGGGLMFPKGDVQALADTLKSLIDDAEKRQFIGQRARKKVEKDHSWDNTVSKTVKLYQEVVLNK